MEASAVQELISQAIQPLLLRIDILEAENKEIKETLSKIPVPKVTPSRVPPNKPGKYSNI